MTARTDFGWTDYQSDRTLGGGLGTATGSTKGSLYGGLASLGVAIRLGAFTVRLQTSVRVSDATHGSFSEIGSEIALGMNEIHKTSTSVLADMGFALNPRQLSPWIVPPCFTLGQERILGNPRVTSTGSLHGFSVSQASAFDSHGLVKAGLGVTAQRNSFSVYAGDNGVLGPVFRKNGHFSRAQMLCTHLDWKT